MSAEPSPFRQGDFGGYHVTDGTSRPFSDESARHVVARAIAEDDGWVEIRPAHWRTAGRVLAALRSSKWPIHRADRPEGEQ